MTNKVTGFEDQATRVTYAYKNTQLQYDEYPPKGDAVPIAAAINAWTLICGCYMGIEQTMKLLIRMRGGVSEKLLKRTHNLECLYELLDPSEWNVVATYYRVYRSLHNFDTGNAILETAKQFIQHVGNGYVAWRYILVENPETVPTIHLGSMLEIWRALADFVGHRVSGGHKFKCWTVAERLDAYIDQNFCRPAENDADWQKAALDENSGVEFREIRDWFYQRGRPLISGIDLLNQYARGTENSIQASPLLRCVLLRAAAKAVNGPLPTHGRADIEMFYHRIRTGGLAWDANKGVFK